MRITFTFISLFLLSVFLKAETRDISLLLPWKHQFQFAGYYMAKERGFYRDAGLHVSIQEYDLKRDNSEAVATQKADFAIGHSSLILDRLNRFENIVFLAAIHQSSPLILLAKKRPDIMSIADITNKKIMMSNDQTSTASINAMLISEDLRPDSYEVIETSFSPLDLINGNADLMLSYASNEPYTLKQKGIEYTIFDPKTYGYDFYSDILFTSSQLIKDDPKTVKAFYEATMKGWHYAYKHIEESTEVILDKYNTQGRSFEALHFEADVLKKLAFQRETPLGHIDPLRVREIINTYRLLGFVKRHQTDLEHLIYRTKESGQVMLTKRQQHYLQQKKSIAICVGSENMPFEGLFDGKYTGISADFIHRLEKELEIPFSIIKTDDMEQSLASLESRQCDIIPTLTQQAPLNSFVHITRPYADIPLSLVTHTDTVYVYDLKSLRGRAIGRLHNSYLDEEFALLDFKEVDSVQEGLEQVASKELYGFIADIVSIKKTLESNVINDLRFTHNIHSTLPMRMIMHTDDTMLHDIIQERLESIDPNERRSILGRWLSAEYIRSFDYSRLWWMGSLMLFIVLTSYLINQRLKRRIRERTQKLDQQISLFDKYISASRTDTKGLITYASEAFCKASGYAREELIGQPHSIIKDPETPKAVFKDLWMTIKSGHTWRGELKNRNKDGGDCWVESVISPLFDSDGTIIGYEAIRHDVSLQKILQDFNLKLESEVKNRTLELAHSQDYLDTLFDVNPSIAYVVEGNTLVRVNKAFLTFTGFISLDAFLKEHDCICDLFEDKEGYIHPRYDPVYGVEYPETDERHHYKAMIIREGEEYIFSVNAKQFTHDRHKQYLVILEDITLIEHTAITDRLTGLYNRVHIDKMITHYIEEFQTQAQASSIMIIDIDHFKAVNDTYGHQVGDDVLKSVADIISEGIRKIDILGRWGGEEFMLILPKTDIKGAMQAAESLRKRIETETSKSEHPVTISIGVVQMQARLDEKAIIYKADSALYRAKDEGRNRVLQG